MALFQESGQTAERRQEEAAKLIQRLESELHQLEPREADFVMSVSNRTSISPKQLFWLRDLCSKYGV